MDKNIFLCGFKHSGKTTLGKDLAKYLNFSFYDIDLEIENIEKMSCRNIYNQKGKKYFQEKELQALIKILNLNGDNKVISTGGGICDNTEAFNLIKKNGISIFLNINKHIIFKRISKSGLPSFLCSKKDFNTLFKYRVDFYRKNCNFNFKPSFLIKNNKIKYFLFKFIENIGV